MRRSLQFAICMVLTICVLPLRGGEVIDRIVATVNRRAILQSDLDSAVRYQALAESRTLESVTAEDVKKVLNRLVDQQLLLEEMGSSKSFGAPDLEVRDRIKEIRKQYPEAVTDQGWRSVLQRKGLEESEVAETIRTQLTILRFVDVRLRPNVRVDNSAIESYYQTEFLPKLHQAGGQEVPLAEVSRRIRQILVERQIDELLGTWLKSLREESDIHTELAEHPPNSGQTVSQAGGAAASQP